MHVVVADLRPQGKLQTLPKATRRRPSRAPQLLAAVVETVVNVVAKTIRVSATTIDKISNRTRTPGSTSITTWSDPNTIR